MNSSERDDQSPEVDPTGVRALLSALPDPGPMPQDLVDRITASLQAEQLLRTPHTDGDAADAGVISLTAERHRRRPGRTLSLLAGAAAVAVAATVASSQLFGGLGDSMPSLLGSSMSDDATGEAADAPATDDADEADGLVQPDAAEQEHDSDPAPAAAGVSLVPGIVELTRTDFVAQVNAWHDGVGGGFSTSQQSEDAVGLRAGDLEAPAAQACAESLPPADRSASGAQLRVAAATLDGADAVLLVQGSPEPQVAWVLPLECTRGPVPLLHGPVDLD